MKNPLSASPRGLLVSAFLSLVLAVPALRAADGPPTVAKPDVSAPVTVTDSGGSWVLNNGIVKATVNKNNSRLTSLVFHGVETMAGGGYWESGAGGQATRSLTIDPASNGGQRAEVSVKAVGGNMDVEARYAMERGSSGIYVYGIYSHKASAGAAGYGENRYITKLNHDFNWISVDKDRNMLECTPLDWGKGPVIHAKEQRILETGFYKNSVEHKYSYNAVQYKIPAYGWSSTKDHIGVFFINPTTEYLSGGASKLELVCHFDANDNPDPIILDYWCAGHYAGGAGCNIPAGEEWSKVIGPIFVYCNALADPKVPSQADMDTLNATAGNPTIPPAWTANGTALWQDALAQAKKERASWPYDWVNGVDYPHKDQRGAVTGQLVLNDPQAATTKLPHLTVGLAHPEFTSGGRGIHAAGGQRQQDHMGSRRELLPVLERWNRGRQVHHFRRPPRHLHAPRVCRRCAGRIHQLQHHRHGGQDPGLGQTGMEARALRQTSLGNRLPRPHRRQILQGRRLELLALGLVRPLRRFVPERHHLHHWQKRLPQGLVL